jgi:hypothetical protein
VFEDLGSTRIDLACPRCQQMFKVRLRKLHFGADLTCRLCWHEFDAREISDRPEVQEALARMHRILEQRIKQIGHHRPSAVTASSPGVQRKLVEHQGDELKPLTTQQTGGQGSPDI